MSSPTCNCIALAMAFGCSFISYTSRFLNVKAIVASANSHYWHKVECSIREKNETLYTIHGATFVFNMKRRSIYYAWTFNLPTLAISVLTAFGAHLSSFVDNSSIAQVSSRLQITKWDEKNAARWE